MFQCPGKGLLSCACSVTCDGSVQVCESVPLNPSHIVILHVFMTLV
jgi:hypothetical protein